jgi:hypothetical protein
MRRMVRFEVEISASACAFPLGFGGQYRPQNSVSQFSKVSYSFFKFRTFQSLKELTRMINLTWITLSNVHRSGSTVRSVRS